MVHGEGQAVVAAASEPVYSVTPLAPDANVAGRVGDFGFMRRVGVAMFVLGSATLLATLSLPDPDPSDHPAIEKHRAIFATAASHRELTEPSLALEGPDIDYIGQAEFRYDKPLKDGDEVLRGRFRVTGPNPHVDVHGHFPVEVAFGSSL
jgi:hypothetical protein